MSWTAVKFANAAARVFHLDEDGKTRIHRVVRNQVAKGVLPTTPDPNDRRGALLFDDNVAAVAMLLIPMADMDITVRGLREAAGYMLGRPLFDPKHSKPGIVHRTPTRIEDALAAVREGKRVELVTRLKWRAKDAQITRDSRFEIEGEGATGRAADVLAAYESIAFVKLAELRIPASDLLKAFFELGDG